MTFSIFHEGDLRHYLDSCTRRMRSEIDQEGEEGIVNVDETEYVDDLVSKHKLQPPTIDSAGIELVERRKVDVPAEHLPVSISGRPGEVCRMTAFVFGLPCSGEAALLRYEASTSHMWTRNVHMDGQYLCFEVVPLVPLEETSAELEREKDEVVENITTQLGHLTADVEAYNAALPRKARELFLARKQQISDEQKLVKALNIPERKK